MIQLRDYQADLIDRLRDALRSHRRVLAQAPTGAGKTAIGSFMVSGVAQRGRRALFLVHRVELVRQTIAAFERQDIPHGVIASGMGFNPHAPCHVGAIQTVARRLDKIQSPDLLIVDEAHHAVSESWAKVIEALNPRHIVGLSATPCRLDGRGLKEAFDCIVPGPSVADLIARGFLSRYRAYAPTTVDLTGVHTTGGDFNRAELAEAMDRPAIIGDAVGHYLKLAAGKRAVVFCASIRHAEHVADAFRAAGVPSATVDGSMASAERAATLARFERGETLILTSCDLVSEGFDLPAIEAAISLRPTKSLSLWLQQVGRVLRPAPGKDHAIILDHVGNTLRHGLPDDEREWSLDGRKKRAGGGGDAFPIRQCPSCFTVHRPAPSCPTCGHEYAAKPREIEQRDGELVEIEARRAQIAKRQEIGRATTREALQALAAQRGYKPGWVEHILRARGAA